MKKIIIIGAGIAGLSAGVYSLLNGFEIEIFEMHSKPGGECTGWTRGDFHFDNCIHWLMGSKKGTALHKLWETVGALDDSINIVNNETFFSYKSGGETVHIYRDLDRLQEHLLDIAPEDKDLIIEFCRDTKKFIKLEMPVDKPFDMYTKMDLFKMIFKMLPIMATVQKYEKISIKELAIKFKNPLLRTVFTAMIPENYKATSLPSTLASLHMNDSGWPAGGSLAFAKRIAKKLEDLGGKIHYKSKIEEIIIENGTAKGVRASDGSTFLADYIIAAADGHEVIYDILGGRYTDEAINTLYTDNETYPIYSSVYISLGIEADLSKYPHTLYFDTKEPVNSGGMIHNKIPVRNYCYEPSFAPAGSSVAIVFMEADYDWWKDKKKDKNAYSSEKERVATEIIKECETRFPEIKGKIKKVDVATPMTYVRYCNAYKGAWMSWATTPGAKIRSITGILPGLENFYLTGQWLMPPGGLPTAVMTGNWTVQRICKKESIKFNNG